MSKREMFKACLIAAFVFAVGGELCADASVPLVHYRFDGQGPGVTDEGSVQAPAVMLSADGTTADLRSPDSEGVCGAAGDRAFDNRASEGMGNQKKSDAGGVVIAESAKGLNDLVSLTICGWFRAAQPLENGAALVSRMGVNKNGFALTSAYGSKSDLALTINDQQVRTYGQVVPVRDEWQFVAVTYDSAAASGHARFYLGGRDEAVRLVHTADMPASAAKGNNKPLVIGNTEDRRFCFDGLLDQIRVFGSRDPNKTAALNLEQLESIRTGDVGGTTPP